MPEDACRLFVSSTVACHPSLRLQHPPPHQVPRFNTPVRATTCSLLRRFTLVAGPSSRKFALVAGSGRDASELCQALDRQGDPNQTASMTASCERQQRLQQQQHQQHVTQREPCIKKNNPRTLALSWGRLASCGLSFNLLYLYGVP